MLQAPLRSIDHSPPTEKTAEKKAELARGYLIGEGMVAVIAWNGHWQTSFPDHQFEKRNSSSISRASKLRVCSLGQELCGRAAVISVRFFRRGGRFERERKTIPGRRKWPPRSKPMWPQPANLEHHHFKIRGGTANRAIFYTFLRADSFFVSVMA